MKRIGFSTGALAAGNFSQIHVSEVNTQSKHDPLSLESILAFQKVFYLLPPNAQSSWRAESKNQKSTRRSRLLSAP
jgi:hypothetical protein